MTDHDEANCPNCIDCPGCDGGSGADPKRATVRVSRGVAFIRCADCDGEGLICACECHQ